MIKFSDKQRHLNKQVIGTVEAIEMRLQKLEELDDDIASLLVVDEEEEEPIREESPRIAITTNQSPHNNSEVVLRSSRGKNVTPRDGGTSTPMTKRGNIEILIAQIVDQKLAGLDMSKRNSSRAA